MDLLNIDEGNRDDAFYRYKMPKLITKIEGRGNGIKTNLVNMVDVAKDLARPPSYTTKYFGCEMGAQSKFDKKLGLLLSMVLMIIQNLWLCWIFLLISTCNAMDVAMLRQKSLYQKHQARFPSGNFYVKVTIDSHD
jgi:hypothetical protein